MPPEKKTLDKSEILSKPQTRELSIDSSSINYNKDENSIEFSFSSENPVYRSAVRMKEVLGHAPGEYDFTTLDSGFGLFGVDHAIENKIGTTASARVAIDKNGDPQGRVVCKFDDTGLARSYRDKVLSGEIQNVSCVYTPIELLSVAGDQYKIKWSPYEISLLVNKPAADPTVGITRSIDKNPIKEKIIKEGKMPPVDETPVEQPKTPQIDFNAAREAEIKKAGDAEKHRILQISTMGQDHKMGDLASKFINESRSLEDFQGALLNAMKEKGDLIKAPSLTAPTMDMKDLPQYNLLRAIDMAGKGLQLDGIEGEASAEVARLTNKSAQGFYLPPEVKNQQRSIEAAIYNNMRRNLNAAVGTAGGFLVGTDLLTGSFIELSRNRSKLRMLGMQSITGLVGQVAIPGQSGAATGYWVAPGADVTASQLTLLQKAGTPHNYAAQTVLDRSFIQQSSRDAEAFVRSDFAWVVALGHDLAGIAGSGVGPEPRGIIYTADIGDVAANAVLTWSDYVDLETDVAAANTDVNAMNYLTTPEIRGHGKQTLKASGVSGYLITGGRAPGVSESNGYPLHVSNQVPKTQGAGSDEHVVIFGDFSQLVQLQWGGTDIVVNPYSLDSSGATRITIFTAIDYILRNPAGFSVIQDARLA